MFCQALDGSFLSRYAERRLRPLLFQLPPRRTRFVPVRPSPLPKMVHASTAGLRIGLKQRSRKNRGSEIVSDEAGTMWHEPGRAFSISPYCQDRGFNPILGARSRIPESTRDIAIELDAGVCGRDRRDVEECVSHRKPLPHLSVRSGRMSRPILSKIFRPPAAADQLRSPPPVRLAGGTSDASLRSASLSGCTCLSSP